MKLMGVDYGKRRIGVSVTDSTGVCVRGLTTIDCRKTDSPLSALVRLIEQEKPQKIVFGLPLGPDDEETYMSREVRSFADTLMQQTRLAVTFIDESFSSRRAEQFLSFKSRKKRHDKANVDRIAACLILEEYLKEI
ncbi:MAG: Holliday junction resolvase RuvX [Chitinivibrionales bacterium]